MELGTYDGWPSKVLGEEHVLLLFCARHGGVGCKVVVLMSWHVEAGLCLRRARHACLPLLLCDWMAGCSQQIGNRFPKGLDRNAGLSLAEPLGRLSR